MGANSSVCRTDSIKICINKIVISNKPPFCKQDFKYLIGYYHNKKLDLYVHYFKNAKYYFHKTKHTNFIIEKEKVSDRSTEILEKVSNMVKKYNNKLITNKNIYRT